MIRVCALIAAAVALTPMRADGSISYLSQERSVSAATSFDGAAQSVMAADFGPFVETVDLSVSFPTVAGGVGENRGRAGIDCELDPNRVRLSGAFVVAGGEAVVAGGGTEQVFGEGRVFLRVTFEITELSQFDLLASPRLAGEPGDRFKIVLEQVGGDGSVLFALDENDPAQAVNETGEFLPGVYELEYEAQLTSAGPESLGEVSFELRVPTPGAIALLIMPGAAAARRRR